jgi:hypothetical protein
MLNPKEIWRRIWAEAAPEGKVLAASGHGQVEERPIDELWLEDCTDCRRDIQKGCLYSMLDVGPGEECTEYTLFGYGLSDREEFCSPRGRPMRESKYSIAETNLRLPFELPVPDGFLVQEIGVVFSPTVRPELRNQFCEHHGVEFRLGEKWYQRYPLAGLFTVSAEPALAASQGFLQIGKVPILLENRASFRMVVEASEVFKLADRVRLWGVLRGFHSRGIQ